MPGHTIANIRESRREPLGVHLECDLLIEQLAKIRHGALRIDRHLELNAPLLEELIAVINSAPEKWKSAPNAGTDTSILCHSWRVERTGKHPRRVILPHNEKMPMMEMTIDDQTFLYDPEATAAIYTSLRAGWAEDCGCAGCRNLMAQGDEVYPSAFRELLQRLGIDPKKEAEAVADGPVQNGLYHYGGWFFFVGEMLTVGDSMSAVSESPYFGYFITRSGPCPKEFYEGPKLAVGFEADFKWVLNESWDSDFRPAATARETGVNKIDPP